MRPLCSRLKITFATRLARLHRDEQGAMSLLVMFAVLGFTLLLVMVTNVAKQVDAKIKIQNAADAAAISGGTVLARGMNAIAFANHLEAEVFALTALLRELNITPGAGSTAQVGNSALPVFEFILANQLIPQYQATVLSMIPQIAGSATNQIAMTHGGGKPRFDLLTWGVLWRTEVQSVQSGSAFDADETNPLSRTLPFINPNGGDLSQLGDETAWRNLAIQQRQRWANRYLSDWIKEIGTSNPGLAAMIAIGAAARLDNLLKDQYAFSNLPFLLRSTPSAGDNATLQRDYAFVAVCYRPRPKESGGTWFRKNPYPADSTAYAQIQLFLPKSRYACCPWVIPDDQGNLVPNTDGWPSEWSSFNQNWLVKLSPATATTMTAILSMPAPGVLRPPLPGRLSPSDFEQLNTH